MTSAPLDVVDLCKLKVRRVSGEESRSSWDSRRQADLRVDVEWETGSARRPNNGFDAELVGEQVVARLGARQDGFSSCLHTCQHTMLWDSSCGSLTCWVWPEK
jgi:hypothetical protein